MPAHGGMMKKLHLDADALAVVSFPTAAEPYAARGTVDARAATSFGQQTCGVTCQTSCGGGGHCTCYPA